MKNFKKRWFRLTNHEFTYHKTKGKLKGFTLIAWHCFHVLPLCQKQQEGEKLRENLLNAHLARTLCTSSTCGEDYAAEQAILLPHCSEQRERDELKKL